MPTGYKPLLFRTRLPSLWPSDTPVAIMPRMNTCLLIKHGQILLNTLKDPFTLALLKCL